MDQLGSKDSRWILCLSLVTIRRKWAKIMHLVTAALPPDFYFPHLMDLNMRASSPHVQEPLNHYVFSTGSVWVECTVFWPDDQRATQLIERAAGSGWETTKLLLSVNTSTHLLHSWHVTAAPAASWAHCLVLKVTSHQRRVLKLAGLSGHHIHSNRNIFPEFAQICFANQQLNWDPGRFKVSVKVWLRFTHVQLLQFFPFRFCRLLLQVSGSETDWSVSLHLQRPTYSSWFFSPFCCCFILTTPAATQLFCRWFICWRLPRLMD